MQKFELVRKKLEKADQLQLLRFYDDLNDDEKNEFLDHLDSIDFDEMNILFKKAMESMNVEVQKLDDKMRPVPESQYESEEKVCASVLNNYRTIGLEEISKGKVAVILMAGGQGTRLGVDYPKGMFSVGLPSKKSLFQIQAERILRLQNMAKEKFGRSGVITWYIMTSAPTVTPTEKFLRENNYFGLKPENVIIFQQGVLPCFDFDGKILLEDKNKIAVAPDGNGGIYRALKESGVLDDMIRRDILHTHIHCVDNILTRVADPIFIGYCHVKGSDCADKVCPKDGPFEPVGVVCVVDGQYRVVEYSEISEKTAALTDEKGNLVFNAGNICNHYFSRRFLEMMACKYLDELQLHVAKKKIPYVNEKGEKIKPTSPNGIKVEKFVFDSFPFSKNFLLWEVPRHVEFSALKNADDAGKDCPSTSRRDLFRLHKMYVERAGGQVNGDVVEISPLLSYEGEGIGKLVCGKVLESPVYLCPENGA